MDLNLRGKHALVGGSSKGIGKAAAIELAALGADVTLMARSADLLELVKQELDHSQGQTHDYLVVDFTDSDDLRDKVRALAEKKTIHILVNNTGGPPSGPIIEAQPAQFLSAFHNHLICNHILVQAVVPGMTASGYGRIINVVSTSVKSPIDNLGVSNTTRGAVGNWAKTLANELGPRGITVNNVLPGATHTERLAQLLEQWGAAKGLTAEQQAENMKAGIPLRRFAEPQELGAAVAFLATPAAAYITGTNLVVDGGRTKML
ncbi:MAG: SDR family oxidoreductase [Lewinella sp.]|nr:SDR family oxidoreductase [Lewinella sp.]